MADDGLPLMRSARRQLHGEDLMDFVNAPARQNAALLLIDKCKLQRVCTEGIIRFQREPDGRM